MYIHIINDVLNEWGGGGGEGNEWNHWLSRRLGSPIKLFVNVITVNATMFFRCISTAMTKEYFYWLEYVPDYFKDKYNVALVFLRSLVIFALWNRWDMIVFFNVISRHNYPIIIDSKSATVVIKRTPCKPTISFPSCQLSWQVGASTIRDPYRTPDMLIWRDYILLASSSERLLQYTQHFTVEVHGKESLKDPTLLGPISQRKSSRLQICDFTFCAK